MKANVMIERVMGKCVRGVLAWLAGAAMAGVLVGCGGDGAGAGGGSAGTTTTVTDIQLITDKTTLPSAGGSATITALVKDSRNNVLPSQAVSFSTPDTGVALTPSGFATDSTGQVKVKLDLGSNAAAKTNRTVTVTATSGSVVRTIDLAVTGTTLAIVGPVTVTPGGVGNYTVSVLDSASVGIAGVQVAATSALGNPLAPVPATTDARGQATVQLTAVAAGSDQLRFGALGLVALYNVTVPGGGTALQWVSPSTGTEAEVNVPVAVSARYLVNGAGEAGRVVNFATTRGGFAPSNQPVVSAATDASGLASVTLQSTSAGIATLSAVVQGTTLTASGQTEFISSSPAKISLSPSPTSIGANAPGSSSSSSQLVAVVRDSVDNPVKGIAVAFSAPTDPSGGRIEPAVGVTDSGGKATVSFIAGPNSTGPDGVEVRALVVAAPTIAQSRRLTVSSVALFIELGTGNTIEEIDQTTYSMPWTAIVTDANRNPIAGAKVSTSLVATGYYKGYWARGETSWIRLLTLAEVCPSEDRNGNNLLDAATGTTPGEDTNGNGRLDPGSPAAVTVRSAGGVTEADGRALLSIVYPKSFGDWVEAELTVTIGTTGTESRIVRKFLLPVASTDVSDLETPPPNVGLRTSGFPADSGLNGFPASPYGFASSCSNKN